MSSPLSPPAAAPRPKGRSARGSRQLEDVVDVLYRQRWVILAATLIGLVAAAAYALSLAPMYQTSALVLVDLDRSQGARQASPEAPDPLARGNRSVSTELFVLNASRGIRQRVSDRLADENGRLPPGYVSFSRADRNVESGVRINASSPDPQAAAALANAYAEEYVEQTRLASRSYLTSTREFLEEQAERLRGVVTSADATTEGRMAAAGTSVVGAGQLSSQLSALQAQIGEARIERQMRTNRLSTITDQLEDITPRLADRLASGTDRRIADIDRELSGLRTELQTFERREAVGQAVDQSQARPLRDRIASLERERDRLSRAYVDEVMDAGGVAAPTEALSYVAGLQNQASQERIEISGLDGRIRQLQSRIGQVESQLGRAPSQVVSLERATQDREAAAQTYASVAAELEQVRVQEASEPGYARVLREAPVPFAPSGAGWTRLLGLGLGLGLGAGLALGIARDRLDNRVYKPEHVTALGVPVLEAVPDLKPVVKDILGGAERFPLGDRRVVSELVTVHAPLSPASETYRHLRTAVQFSRPDVVVRTLVVTSPGAGEGKSTTASNLATAFAQSGRTTVLVDTDFRRPRIHDVFDLPVQPGLYQFVAGRLASSDQPDPSDLKDELDAHFATGVENLYAVPAGVLALEDPRDAPDDGRPIVANPTDVLGSPALRAVLEGLREAVDVVVIDTPPVLVATDAVLLSTQADATLLVTSAGTTKTGDVEQALAHLDDVGAHVIGAVLNRFSLDKALGYAYTYGHYSRYGAYSTYTSTDSKRRRKRRSERRPTPTA